jgi:hypothetical protein
LIANSPIKAFQKPEGDQPLSNLRPGREDNIKTFDEETGWEDVERVHLALGKCPLLGSCEHGNELYGSIKFEEFLD